MAHMNESVVNFNPNTYADEGGQICKVDCSLGVNLEPLPQKVLDKLKDLSPDHLKNYPHSEDVFKCVLKKLNKLNPELTIENIAMGCGSIDVLLNINNLFINRDKKVLGYAPQFSAYIDDINLKEATYIPVNMIKENNYKIDVRLMCKEIELQKPDLIYLDNPNNPTGQILSKDQLEKIYASAEKVDAAMIVDEAYGDYMDQNENSIIDHVNANMPNLIVVKTMSKGYGMAGMRVGYAVASKEIISQLNKLLVPFNCNNLARDLTIAMLDEDDYLQGLKETTERKIKKVKDTLTGKIKIAYTADCVPISLLYTDDENINLTKLLGTVGIAAVSGASFDNLSINSVRLMVPAEKDMDLLCQLLKEAEALI